MPDGKRMQVSLETADLAEAISRKRQLEELPLIREKTGPGACGRMAAEVDRFLVYKRRMGEYTEATALNNGYVLRRFCADLGNPSIAAVTTADTQRFYDRVRRERSETTAHGQMMKLRSFFRWAKDVERLIHRNPAHGVVLAKVEAKGRKDFCSAELRDRLIDQCPREDLKFVLYCGFHAGLRFQEIVEAKAFWFDLPAGLLHLRKHSGMQFKDREERSIPMTDEFLEFIKAYGLREPYMLRPDKIKGGAGRSRKGTNRYRYDFGRPFDLYMEAQGVPWVTPHTMRHTFASLLVSANASIYSVAVWLGDDVRVVQRHYAKLTPMRAEIQRAFRRAVPALASLPGPDEAGQMQGALAFSGENGPEGRNPAPRQHD